MTFDHEESARRLIVQPKGYILSCISTNQDHPVLLKIATEIQLHIDNLNQLGHKLPPLSRFNEGEGRRFYRSGEIIAEIEAVHAFIEEKGVLDFLGYIELSRIVIHKFNAWNQRISDIGRERVQICSLEEVSAIFIQLPQELQKMFEASLANLSPAALIA